MAVSKLSRRIGGLAAAVVLGIAGMGVLATPASADVTGSISLRVDSQAYADGMVAQVGQSITATLDSTAEPGAEISWTWFCGTAPMEQWGGVGDSSTYEVTPDSVGCSPMTIHVGAMVSDVAFASSEVPLTPVSLNSGYQYTDFKNSPSWGVLQGYDPGALPVGTVVVTNWGSTAVEGLSCALAPQQGSSDTTSHFTIVTQPKNSLPPRTATIVQILPVAGVAGSEKGTSVSEMLTCTTGQGTKWASPRDAGVSMVVYSKPFIDIYAYELQVGTVLNDSNVNVFPAADSVSYEWYSEAASGTRTALSTSSSYTVLPADVGKTIGVKVSATLAGFDPLNSDEIVGVVPPVAVTDGEFWSVPYGYSASDLTPSAAAVTFTNFGATAITDIAVTCESDSPALVCSEVPDVKELGPGESMSAITVTPQVGEKIADYSATISLRNDDYSVDAHSYAFLNVNPGPFAWIQPLESPSSGNGNNGNAGQPGGASTDSPVVGTGGMATHGSAGLVLAGLGFIAMGAMVLKRRAA